MNDEWIICPTCRTRLNRVCPNCSRLVGLDWSLCAWCGKDFERRDMSAAAIAGPRPAAIMPLPGSIDETGRIAAAEGPTPRAARGSGPRSLGRSEPRSRSQDVLPES